MEETVSHNVIVVRASSTIVMVATFLKGTLNAQKNHDAKDCDRKAGGPTKMQIAPRPLCELALLPKVPSKEPKSIYQF
ncbi:hypothetical protein CEXT_439371 [Caerostris extrusa]|uniref:Uncharacterized protein n=1 Tax=Caerostris extrusa TaxID=172846 RepID=A0AAV4TN95_CAEEX|nr:hypothetical protein CEXT_439371 [Caerostris extrusa]